MCRWRYASRSASNTMTMLSFRHLRAALFAMLAVAVLALTACSDKPAFKNLDITGSKSFGTDFSLTDHTG